MIADARRGSFRQAKTAPTAQIPNQKTVRLGPQLYFREGVSGHPQGRPRGARNRSTRLAEALLEDEAVALVRQANDLAKAGDITAIRLCLERLIPRRVERAIEFQMPPIAEPKDAVAALSQIIEGIGGGELTASEAHSLVSVVEATLKAIEVLNLDQRLLALEERTSHARS